MPVLRPDQLPLAEVDNAVIWALLIWGVLAVACALAPIAVVLTVRWIATRLIDDRTAP